VTARAKHKRQRRGGDGYDFPVVCDDRGGGGKKMDTQEQPKKKKKRAGIKKA